MPGPMDVAALLLLSVALCWVALGITGAMAKRRPLSPYAALLDAEVLVRKYEASDWEPCVVVAVSKSGAVCVRRIEDRDVTRSGFWIKSELAPERVRWPDGTSPYEEVDDG